MSKHQSPPPPSETIRLFLSRLRLLDLDKIEGWSDISVHALMSKDAGPNQKARIQAAEWTLFHLFKLWNLDEATNVRASDRSLDSDMC